jgi:hypothetical protein
MASKPGAVWYPGMKVEASLQVRARLAPGMKAA